MEHVHKGEVESFPGRRGKGRDAIFHPLSFREFLKVMNPDIYSSLEVIKGLNPLRYGRSARGLGPGSMKSTGHSRAILNVEGQDASHTSSLLST